MAGWGVNPRISDRKYSLLESPPCHESSMSDSLSQKINMFLLGALLYIIMNLTAYAAAYIAPCCELVAIDRFNSMNDSSPWCLDNPQRLYPQVTLLRHYATISFYRVLTIKGTGGQAEMTLANITLITLSSLLLLIVINYQNIILPHWEMLGIIMKKFPSC